MPDTNSTGLPRVLLIGDSITRSCYPAVEAKLKGKAYCARIATSKALDTPEEPAAWITLAARRRAALLIAAIPAWIGALAVFVGLEAVPLCLLALSTLVLFYLYRIPRQLG